MLDQIKVSFLRSLEVLVKPFLGYKIGERIPILKTIFYSIQDLSKPNKVKVFGQWLILNPSDRLISREIILKGVFEEFETSLLSYFLHEGMTVLDIGANVGYYTLLAAQKVGNNGKVYAFEPDKDNFSVLVQNIEFNKHLNVECFQYAVSDEDGYLELYLSADNKGDHRTRKVGGTIKNRDFYRVKSINVDNFFTEAEVYPEIIKMDIQGFEYFALVGMKDLIKRAKELALFIEFWPHGLITAGLDSPKILYDLLENLDFEIFSIDEQSKQVSRVENSESLINSILGESFTNLLCMKGESTKQLFNKYVKQIKD